MGSSSNQTSAARKPEGQSSPGRPSPETASPGQPSPGRLSHLISPNPDDYYDDDDYSSLGNGGSTSTSSLTSLGSSVANPVEKYGRTFNAYKTDKYLIPNDEREQDRLDFEHAIHSAMLDGELGLAPIKDIPLHNVLDIATGTGLWATDFADAHPSARVIGTDLAPIQPTTVPVNCSFEVDDAEDEWIFSHTFEYIHARSVISCFKDARQIFQSAFNFLTPGGYLEFQDVIFPPVYAEPPPKDSPFVKLVAMMQEATDRTGRPLTNARYYAEWMRDVGLINVVDRRMMLAIGSWPDDERERKIGQWNLANWIDGLDAMVPLIVSACGWTMDEANVLVANARNELRSGKLKAYTHLAVVWGSKPGPDKT